ncbi:PilZ domain-containing protein [Novosphingobium guangzhouense]|uniref:PilZ domain-containing protein n=1 Tax=Novosphingobium guangzhouense TaxID=1850347 RepID=A0A2K2FT10_9SPHN|nr:PilZ domain-containing protein [Novosphingobium guangzhouense]PNU01929.1 hypothetical protein A8V01_10745 [Novosphingobium guangzhouense]
MEARSWSRHIVEKDVACLVGGERQKAFLYDLSIGGCMFEMDRDRDVRERAVTLDLHDNGTMEGQVVWQIGRCVGLRFDALIPEAVVRRLGFVPPSEAFCAQLPRDRGGHPLPPQP